MTIKLTFETATLKQVYMLRNKMFSIQSAGLIVFLLPLLFFAATPAIAQNTDSSHVKNETADTLFQKVDWSAAGKRNPFPLKQMVAPTLMIMYGVAGIENRTLKNINLEIKEELVTEHPHNKFQLDDYLVFAPAATVYGLNALGIKGKHNFRDRTMIYLMSNVFVGATVFSVKKFSHEYRPDNSNYLSFPSGHTAMAFAGAEFLRREYKDVSPWYGVAGYAMAAATGYLRMYNNKHWFNDVVAGAGVGIASTNLAYWLYPKIQHTLFKDKPVKTVVMPTYQSGSFGVGIVHKF